MNTKTKKGFTLTELIIVVVIIGILAAVLIPTLTACVKKAKISNDKQLVRNLNLALKNDEEYVISGNKHEHMQAALDAAFEAGYDVSKINATKYDNEILWDSENDVFCYLNDGDVEYIPDSISGAGLEANDYRLWKISKTVDDNYSTYYIGEETTINTSKGFDAGTNTNITAINYTNSGSIQHATIRTNGGILTINAKNDDVKHYGFAESVNVIDVASASYHENGTVQFLEVAAGHIVLEEKAAVTAFHFTATGTGSDAKFENADGKTISIDISNLPEEKLPDFSRDPVTIATNGTYVAEVKSDTTEYIWLFGQGIKEQMVVTSTEGAIASNGQLNGGIEVGAEDGSVAEQIANPAKRNDAGYLVDENNVVIDLEEVDLTQSTALATTVVVETLPTKAEIIAAATEFAGGKGTKNDPWLIVDYDTFQNVSNHWNDSEFHYWKCKDNLVIEAVNWTPVKLYGSIEGNGVVLNNLDNTLFSNTLNDRDNNGNPINIVKISNMTLNCNIFSTSSASSLVRTAADDLYVDNVDVHGQIVGYSVGGYVDYGSGNYGNAATRNWQVTFKDCENDAKLVAYGESIGGFIQHPYCDISQRGDGTNIANYKSKITIIDSVYTGVMCTNGQYSYLTYQGWQNNRVVVQYSEEFINLYGQDINDDGVKEIEGYLYYTPVTNTDGTLSFSYAHRYNQGGNYRPTDNDSKFKIKAGQASSNPENYGDAYTFTKVNGAATVKISFMINPNDAVTESGSYTGTYVDETIDISALSNGETFNTDKIRYWTIAINPNGATKTGVSGTQFNVVNSFYGKTHNGSNIYAVFYSSTGEVVGVTSVKVCDPVPQVYMRANGLKIKGAGVETEYTYDTGVDLSLYDVKVQYVNRDDTWNWNYTADWTTDLDTSLYSVSGSIITIHYVEGVPCTASSWFAENGYGYGGSHQIINIVFTLKDN